MVLMRFSLVFFLLFCACGGGSGKKVNKLDREILGAEMAFGRQAAHYDLWREAIFRWEKVIAADPQNAEAANNLAVAYESIGDYGKAENLYKTALQLDEDSESIRKNYKRFQAFYKEHQRQLEREAKQKSKVEEENVPEGGQK